MAYVAWCTGVWMRREVSVTIEKIIDDMMVSSEDDGKR